MWKDALLLTVSAVLFVQMGLSAAVQDLLRIKFRVVSCPKCLTFWSVLAWSLTHGGAIVESRAASFLSAYTALWLALLYDAIAVLYNKAYDKVSPTDNTDKAGADEMSELQP